MSMAAVQPAGTGLLGAVKTFDAAALRRALVRDDLNGHYRPGRERHLLHVQDAARREAWQKLLLAWLRDHVHPGLPRTYYRAVLGHDLHVSAFATLHVQHYHATEPDPFTGRTGWLENVGLVSCGKVTTAFRDFEIDCLVTDSTTYGDFKYHEVGNHHHRHRPGHRDAGGGGGRPVPQRGHRDGGRHGDVAGARHLQQHDGRHPDGPLADLPHGVRGGERSSHVYVHLK
jgi:hypothetical protein